MSRIRKAAITAGFAYGQFGVSIATGILMVPLTLHYVGARPWGLWLATGELLGYAGMADLGVLGVLPWMIAEADGRQDRAAMRKFVGHGVWIGSAVSVAYASISALLWLVLPSALRLSAPDRLLVLGPFALLVALNAFSHPFRVFRATIGGLQDASFNGILSIVHLLTTVGLTAALLVKGYGLFALAIGAGVPPFITFAASIVRLRMIAPDLMSGWQRPTVAEARLLLTNGSGVWLGALGWQLLAATNAIVITYLRHPEWVPIYNCTAKLSLMTTQLVWVLPDSALVGLAQLYGERKDDVARLRSVVLMLLRLHLLLAGAVACGLLAFNPSFVTRWVGGQFFGGVLLNAFLAAGVVMYSLVHGLITTASVLGNRLKVGVVGFVNGVGQTVLAVLFGHWWGLPGVAAAGLLAAIVTSVPAGLTLLRPSTALSVRHLARELIGPWLVRAAAIIALAAAAGAFYESLGLVLSASIAAVIGAAYLWHMRPLYVELPLDARWTERLVRIKLVPATAAAVAHPAAALDQV